MSEIPSHVIENALCVYLNGSGDDDVRDFRVAAMMIAEHVRAEERAAVVAHLRMIAEFEYGLSNIVDAIETGEHVK